MQRHPRRSLSLRGSERFEIADCWAGINGEAEECARPRTPLGSRRLQELLTPRAPRCTEARHESLVRPASVQRSTSIFFCELLFLQKVRDVARFDDRCNRCAQWSRRSRCQKALVDVPRCTSVRRPRTPRALRSIPQCSCRCRRCAESARQETSECVEHRVARSFRGGADC